MFILAIDFQDGFSDDTVVLRIDGEEVARKEEVTTSPLLGLATTLQAEVQKGPASIEISIPTRNLKETLPLDIAADTYLGVKHMNGHLAIRVAKTPFGYA